MYIRLSNNQYPVSEREIRDANPNTSFATPFNPDGYAVVFPVPQPAYDQYSQKCVEQVPVVSVKGTWEQVWLVSDLTGEELEAAQARKVADELAKREAMVLSMRQCRLQLLAEEKLDDVQAAINTMGQAAIIDWEYAADVKRMFPLVVAMQALFQWTDAEMDQFFVDGALL
jgi:hypothetical protein